jgi:hypothetical protein
VRAPREELGLITGLKAALTAAAVVLPNLLIMRAMGWTSLPEVSVAIIWAAFSSWLVVLIPARHRRNEFSKKGVAVTLLGWVLLGALVLSTEWESRAILAALLVLPGLNFLLFESLGLAPVPDVVEPLS